MDSIQPERGIAQAARQLRLVKKASRRFLALWVIQDMVQENRQSRTDGVGNARARLDDAIADPFNHDWSLLYRGNILDD